MNRSAVVTQRIKRPPRQHTHYSTQHIITHRTDVKQHNSSHLQHQQTQRIKRPPPQQHSLPHTTQHPQSRRKATQP
ncbi:hypothetical protein Pmani_020814 [Petrolisthes manimaculis]|uniref:Uncharacterized protein n=1 Tax=Petrolisthes manimaculis TaxID=1843537 RepID=A0AAE1PEZ6_9EUCA|nr:hypothetical protein Pmani_020814 [Petrolisthes manimaculis]